MVKREQPRSCLTCIELRRSEPLRPGYVGCAWGFTPVRPGTTPEDMMHIGHLLMVREDCAVLEQACSPELGAWRFDSTRAPDQPNRNTTKRTRSQPWSKPQSSNAAANKAAQARITKRLNEAKGKPDFVCQYCGSHWPALTLSGKARRACGNSECRSKVRTERRIAEGRALPPRTDADTVISIRREYATGTVGYRRLGQLHNLHPTTIRDIVLERTHRGVRDGL